MSDMDRKQTETSEAVITTLIAAVKTDTADVRTDVTAIHDTDLPAVKTDTADIRTDVTAIHDTDLPAVKTDTETIIANILSAEEKSLLGIGVFPGFNDYFDTVANDADPNTINWSVIENTGTVNVENDTAALPGYLICNSGGATGNDGLAHTKDKRVFSLKNGVTTIHLKSYLIMNWAGQTGYECGIGFMENEQLISQVIDLIATAYEVAAIVSLTGNPNAYSSDGTTTELTDLSSYISDNTGFLLEIVISASDVKFYVNGTLRATHTTNVPSSVWQVCIGATCCNNIASITKSEYIKVWGE